MKPALRHVGGANVICFAIIDSRVQPTGNCKQIVGGVLQGPASGLAICQYEGEHSFYLFGCDEHWQSVTDTWHETLEDAEDQAEFEYAGVSEVWINTVDILPGIENAVHTNNSPVVVDPGAEYGKSLDSADPALIVEVQALLQSGKPVTAIQRYKEKADVGLREAKYAVEQLREQMYRSDSSST